MSLLIENFLSFSTPFASLIQISNNKSELINHQSKAHVSAYLGIESEI